MSQHIDKHCSIHNFDYFGDACTVCKLIEVAGSWDNIWNHHTHEVHQQELLTRAAFVSYECGKVLKIVKKCNHNNRAIDHLYRGYIGDVHADFSDVVAQIVLFSYIVDVKIDNAFTIESDSASDLQGLAIDLTSAAADFLQVCTYAHVSDNRNKCEQRIVAEYFKLISVLMQLCKLMRWDIREVADFGKTRLRNSNTNNTFKIAIDMKVLNRE